MSTRHSAKPRKLNFESHKLSVGEEEWLQEAYRLLPNQVSVRAMKAKLYLSVGTEFDPKQIDRRFYTHPNIHLLGVWRVTEGKAPVFDYVSRFIAGVRPWLLAHPDSSSIEGEELRAQTGLTDGQLREALQALDELHLHYNLGRFFSARSDKVDGIQRVSFAGDDALDEYLSYVDQSELFERAYLKGLVDQRYLRAGRALEKKRELDRSFQDPYSPSKALILMAMGNDKPGSELTLSIITQTCYLFGLEAERVDAEQHSGPITELLLRRIREAKLIIADLTFERPNVYYEVGYAHACGINPIMFQRKGTHLHFDLKVHNVPEWDDHLKLQELLIARLRFVLGRDPINVLEAARTKRKEVRRPAKQRRQGAV